MDQKEKSRRNFDRQAVSYDSASHGYHARKLYPVLLSQLEQIPHSSILDLGCGTGALLAQIKERMPEASCAGLDLSEEMLAVARGRLGTSAELTQGDSECLPYEDGRFEVVVCNDSFHHYVSPEKVLKEVARVLSPGGVFLMGDTTAPAGLRGAMNLLLPYSSGGDVRLYGGKELEKLLRGVFSGVESRRVDLTSLVAWGIRAA